MAWTTHNSTGLAMIDSLFGKGRYSKAEIATPKGLFAKLDLDGDGHVTRDELHDCEAKQAFDYADRQVQDFFENANRLATEHPQLEGDGAARFILARLKAPEKPTADPALERLTQQRDEIDEQIEALQSRRERMDTNDYFDQLQELMIDLALVEDQIERIIESNEDTP